MKRLVGVFMMLLVILPNVTFAQQGWCGYALIEGLTVLSHQLTVFETITPPRNPNSQPDQLFQYRYNLDHSAFIIDGCFEVEPTRELVVDLLAAALFPGQGQAGHNYIDQNLVYSPFGLGATQGASAALARAYLITNQLDWEPE